MGYNSDKPRGKVGIRKEENRNEKSFPGASAEQFSMWTNAGLPDCQYGRVHRCAHGSPLSVIHVYRHIRSGSYYSFPGLFVPKKGACCKRNGKFSHLVTENGALQRK